MQYTTQRITSFAKLVLSNGYCRLGIVTVKSHLLLRALSVWPRRRQALTVTGRLRVSASALPVAGYSNPTRNPIIVWIVRIGPCEPEAWRGCSRQPERRHWQVLHLQTTAFQYCIQNRAIYTKLCNKFFVLPTLPVLHFFSQNIAHFFAQQ